MIVDEKLWGLIHEYKLVQTQAQCHLANSHIDKYIDCIDMLFKIEADIEKYQWELQRKVIVFLNVN